MRKKLTLQLIVVIFVLAVFVPYIKVQAATLTNARDYLTRQAQNLTSGETHEVQFTPATNVSGGTGANKVILVFPLADGADWCRTAGTDLSVSVAGLKDSATALPGTSKTAKCTQGNDSTTYDTITVEGVDNLIAGTSYAVKISDGSTGKLGTPANTTTGLIIIKTYNGSTDIDTRTVATDILTTDQISVSGTVDPTLSFAITDTAIGFGSITAAAVRHATSDEAGAASEPANGNPTQLQVSTNAASGAVIEIKDSNAVSASGLYNSASATTLTSRASTSVSLGVVGFGIYGKNSSSLTIAEAFDNDTTGDLAISTAYQTFASSAAPISSAYVDVAALSAVAGSTPAGSYADTLTVVATGKF
jgi:hypothetical protein